MADTTTTRRVRRFDTRSAIRFVLGLQIALAVLLMGGDLVRIVPQIWSGSDSPSFDTPVQPGDQTRRYRPSDMPLAPGRDGNPTRLFRSTGDMPDRLEFTQDGGRLTLTGAIAPGDAARLDTYLEGLREDLTDVRLNSPGGSVGDALLIGQGLRDAGLITLLLEGDICLSACPYILAGGVERAVDPDGQVGVHQHFFGTNTVLPAFLAVEDIQRGQGEVMRYLDAMGIDPLVMQHALVTPPDEIYILLPEELTLYRMVTDGTANTDS